MKLKISMDLDGCLCDFYGPYFKKFGNPKKDTEISKNVQNILLKEPVILYRILNRIFHCRYFHIHNLNRFS